MSILDIAAHNLLNRTLKNEWIVTKKLEPRDGATGGFFSVCYIVERGNDQAFLKALNFNAFFQMFPGRGIVRVLQEQTSAFEFEKSLLLKCKNNKLTKVSMIIDEGEEVVDGFTIPNVPYLIFEIAEGDIRSNIKFSNNADLAWKAKSLHDVAVALDQLHSVDIAHQDLKPSNVLLYDSSNISKIGDLGRSLCSTIQAPHDDGSSFTGQMNYSPPEFLYGYIQPNWLLRVNSTDMYLFGSLVTYYFLGVNMTALISRHLDIRFRWTHFQGTFDEVKNYLIEAYSKCIDEISVGLGGKEFANDLIDIIKYCCYPIPEKRGHKKNVREIGGQFSYRRVISKLDLIKRKAELKVYNND
ncbi:protein kinase domain-containing protein [Elizabethkingia anophelis]|uniref:protein kinase domain-containing protein n=1 Tax=Elizabethkingia anophelis TaxID=1117645 RepID=UPI001D7E6A12|nr:protein kinase [Elizabethkingia anophelis]EHM7983045.1 protein kinase [Elizabethkingia anophelis]EHM8030267.1 protein kinase [Elizabethkingia anophelis]EHZ9533021.1 protein kinase [Elizabethkingia anophelis]EKU3670931.1 protein kinase [Elizabethkingia anophelis]EKW9476300.1 protein kinase [Elizabethkingia anophelis]